jgi:cysteinyl-tRNA synthetase
MLKIYNSLTQQKEEFKPIQAGKIKIYVCGPTVYDFCHIGNARSFTAFDIVVRYLRFRGYEVEFVRNITDIDDKIIKRANDNKEDFYAVVSRFTQAMHEDLDQIGLLRPDHEPKATEYVPQIVKLIEKLIANGMAYVASNGDVYYEVRKFKNYGCLSHRNIDDLESGARVDVNDVKRDPLDFVLWKLAKPGEPHWSSPWGEGRPGWHIECSAMSTGILGDNFDIHGGGKDLIFPHHENEVAQSEGATNTKFVNVWMHAGYLQIDKEKMSKSLGNFLTIRDLLPTHSPEAIRFLLISSHYRSPLHYSDQALQQARQSLERFYNALRGLPEPSDKNLETDSLAKFEEDFLAAMDDDFNTPIAMSVLFELAHEIQRLKDQFPDAAAQHGVLLKKLGGAFGILQANPDEFLQSGKADLDVAKIEGLIAARNAARASKDWAEADRVRAELTAMSVVLEDGPGGTTTWRVG